MTRSLNFTMTLGPSTEEAQTIARLLRTADRFRLNASHMTVEALKRWLEKLTTAFAHEGRQIPVVLDLQGAKMRVGVIPSLEELPAQVILRHTDEEITGAIPIPRPELFQTVKPGETLSLNDGRVLLGVEQVEDSEIRATVLRNGPLSSYKGINRREHPVTCESLLESDRRLLECAESHPFIQYAFSFVHTGEEADILEQLTSKHIIAKIERPEAMEHLSRIDAHFDELWLCRGDLGAQAGLNRLGPIQAEFTRSLPQLQHPATLAGQVLEHMTLFPEPTRSEIVHLYDIAQAGWHGVVLSDEIAVGRHPIAVADFIDQMRKD